MKSLLNATTTVHLALNNNYQLLNDNQSTHKTIVQILTCVIVKNRKSHKIITLLCIFSFLSIHRNLFGVLWLRC